MNNTIRRTELDVALAGQHKLLQTFRGTHSFPQMADRQGISYRKMREDGDETHRECEYAFSNRHGHPRRAVEMAHRTGDGWMYAVRIYEGDE